LLFLAAFYSHYCYQWVGFTVLLNSVYALQLQSAITSVLDVLNGFAADPLFAEQFELVFGKSISSSAFQAALASLPQFEVRSDQDLAGALGAFSAQTGKIYLTESLVKGDPGQLNAVLLEEIGHYLDFYFNGAIDSAGDEGDIFSRLVRGNSIDAVTLQALKAENDWATVTIDGQDVAIEQSITTSQIAIVLNDILNYDLLDLGSFENVRTTSNSNFSTPPYLFGDGYAARFKNYTPVNTPLYAGLPFNTTNNLVTPTTITPLIDSTAKGLIIHTANPSFSALGFDIPLLEPWGYGNVSNPTRGVKPFLQSIALPQATKNFFAERTYNGGTLNFGDLSYASGPIKVTLVWTGPASNNLDLSLANTNAPYNTIYPTLSGIDTGNGYSDNYEQINLPSGVNGEYAVHVGGISLTQDFSLFITADPIFRSGHGIGDVHLQTFDNKWYDFQAVGEFILAKSLIDDFQVQVRQEITELTYPGSFPNTSMNTAFATTMDGYNVVFNRNAPVGQEISINGTPITLEDGATQTIVSSTIHRQGDKYTFTYAGPDGTISTSDDDLVTAFDGYWLDINVKPADYRSTLMQGLLGNADGISTNDFALRDGTSLGSNPTVQIIHTTYADSWRISQDESFFGTKTFADKTYPANYVSLETLAQANPQAVAKGFAKGREIGIAEGDFLNNGVFDFGVTGDQQALLAAKRFADFALQDDHEVIQLGSIKGSKWNDANGNGIWDTGEQTLAGWTIYIDSVNNGQLDPWELSTVTNADGQYTFSNLGPGEYAIREVNQTGWQQTASPSPVILGAGQTLSNVNFGNVFLPTVTLAVSPNSVTEDGPTNLGYIFTRAGSTINALTVNYGIAGTANATDYKGATPGTGKTITFAAGSATATLTLDPTADTTIENNETVALTLATGTGYTVGTTTAVTGTITNDDLPSINLSPSSQTVVEGLTSPQNLSYTVSLSGSSPQTITVQYSTANGTALAGSDYTATSGTLTFTPGVTSQTISIPILNDSVNEANETFTLKLTSPTNAILGGTATVTTTITDTLSASTTTTLPANVENLTLTGSSVINGTGNAGNNILTGNTANNTLNGGAGNDTLNGGAGNDTLIGGAGKDTLTGGTGTDKFVFTSLADSLLAGYDVISDYTIGEQIDAPPTVAAVVLNTSIGNIGSLSAANIGALPLVANTARAFTVTGQSGTFLVFNDSLNAFNAATDSIVQLSGYSISATNTVTIV
jgi:hypothetical protein